MPFTYSNPRVSPADLTPIDYGQDIRKKLSLNLSDMIRADRAKNLQMQEAEMKLANMKRAQADQMAFRQSIQPALNPQQNQMFNAGLASAGAPPVPTGIPNLDQAMNVLLQQGDIGGYEQLAQAKARMAPKPTKPTPDMILKLLEGATPQSWPAIEFGLLRLGITPEEIASTAERMKKADTDKLPAALEERITADLMSGDPARIARGEKTMEVLTQRKTAGTAPTLVKTEQGLTPIYPRDLPVGEPIPGTQEPPKEADTGQHDKEVRVAMRAGFVKSPEEWDAIPRNEQLAGMNTEEWLQAEREITKKLTPTSQELIDKGYGKVEEQIKQFTLKDPFYKTFREKQISLAPIEEASAGLLAYYENPGAPGMENYSAAVDGMTMLFSFVRNLDNSVVRPGEIAILDAMRGIVGNLETKYGRNFEGMPLQPNDIKRVVDQARKTTEAIRRKAGDAWKSYKMAVPKSYRDIPEVSEFLESQFQNLIDNGSAGETTTLYDEKSFTPDFGADLNKLGGY